MKASIKDFEIMAPVGSRESLAAAIQAGAGRRMGLYPRAATCGRGARHVCCGHYFHDARILFPHTVL